MLYSTVEELIKSAMEADKAPTEEALEKQAEADSETAELELLDELDKALDNDEDGGLQKQASQLGMAKLLVAVDILSHVN